MSETFPSNAIMAQYRSRPVYSTSAFAKAAFGFAIEAGFGRLALAAALLALLSNGTTFKTYALFQEMRAAEKVDFSLIVSRLHKMTRKVEPSFTSKMLATIDDAAPVWDRRVISALKHYDPKLPVVPTEFAGGQIERGIAGYQALQEACRDLLAEPIGKRCIEQFDCYLSDYSAISNMKKLDVVLWCAGN